MDITSALAAIDKGLDFIETVKPLLPSLPYGVGDIAQTVELVTTISANVQQRITEGKIVASSTDQALIRDYASRLSAINDELAKEVDKF